MNSIIRCAQTLTKMVSVWLTLAILVTACANAVAQLSRRDHGALPSMAVSVEVSSVEALCKESARVPKQIFTGH